MPTLLSLFSSHFSFFFSHRLHVDLHPAITQRCDIKSPIYWQQWQHSVLSFLRLSLFISCSQTENKWSHQALVRHKHLVVGARLKYGWHTLFNSCVILRLVLQGGIVWSNV